MQKQAISVLEIYSTQALIQVDKDTFIQYSFDKYDRATFEQTPKGEMQEWVRQMWGKGGKAWRFLASENEHKNPKRKLCLLCSRDSKCFNVANVQWIRGRVVEIKVRKIIRCWLVGKGWS